MSISQLALAAFLTVVASPEPVLLTPKTVDEHGYYVRCYVKEQREESQTKLNGLLLVGLRFAPLPGTSVRDLDAITSTSLVVHDGDAVLLDVPLRTEVDPGNYVHLHAEFLTQKDVLPKTQLRFEENGKAGKRVFIVDIQSFVDVEKR